jgi:hypothetical protein
MTIRLMVNQEAIEDRVLAQLSTIPAFRISYNCIAHSEEDFVPRIHHISVSCWIYIFHASTSRKSQWTNDIHEII